MRRQQNSSNIARLAQRNSTTYVARIGNLRLRWPAFRAWFRLICCWNRVCTGRDLETAILNNYGNTTGARRGIPLAALSVAVLPRIKLECETFD